MKPRPFAKIAAAFSAAFLLGGCALFFGSAATDGQQLYRKAGEYVYASIPVEIYVKKRDADGGVVNAVCGAERDVYNALQDSLANFATNGQRLPMGFLSISKTLGVFSAEVFGSIGIPDDPAEAIGSTKIMISVGVSAAGPMREFRTRFLRPSLELMESEDRDPTVGEWAAIKTQAETQHAAVIAGCN
jgi:hypothetical protein